MFERGGRRGGGGGENGMLSTSAFDITKIF